jgi:hypothetical protein
MLAKRLAGYGLSLAGGALATALAQGAPPCVPPVLVVSTVQAATTVAAGGAAAAGVSAQAAALSEGVLRAMFLTKVKAAAAVLFAVGLLGFGGSAVVYHTVAAQQAARGDITSPVAQRETNHPKGEAEAGGGQVAATPPREQSERYPTLAPFTDVRWKEAVPEVRVQGVWYELRAIDDLDSGKIVAFCKKTYPDRWQKRFGEDLVEVLSRLGHKPTLNERWIPVVRLKVRRLDTGQVQVLDQVPMTEENRRAVWENASRRAAEDFPLSRPQAEADLDELERRLVNQYSYLTLRGVDYRAALGAVRGGLGDGFSRDAFALRLHHLLAQFGDGHTRVNSPHLEQVLPGGYTPFLIGEAEGRLVAFQEDRSGFFDADHPFVTKLDGVPVGQWLQAACRLGPGGSPQFARRKAVENLRYVQYLRGELGLKPTDVLAVELESADGRKVRAVKVAVAPRRPLYGAWPRGGHRLLEGNVGYLRIAGMDDAPAFLQELREALGKFRDTRGLIIDVRGNGGGSREVLRELFPFFMKKDDPPRIANVAAYRLGQGERADAPEGYLHNRFLYPLTAKAWSDDDRAAIRRSAADFQPEWRPPAGAFSAWHYFLLKPRAGKDYYHYDRPVVVLMDSGCFSATDIFLGAFKGWRNVTLVGTPSGGGSGRARVVELSHSRIQLQFSSMASFQPDGKLYDGRGVMPDIEVAPRATDLIGKTDAALETALKRLR